MKKSTTAETQSLLIDILSFKSDPLGFVMYAFPWGEKGTALEKYAGPRKWQVEELVRIGEHLKEQERRLANREMPQIYRSATASGRGIGKSALTSWLNLWFISTSLGGTVINAANTENQLKTVTWGELSKWYALLINSQWFDFEATSVKPTEWLKKQLADMKIGTTYYQASAKLWSEENPVGFAGAHNPLGMMVIFDEASGIPESIWTVTAGFFTEVATHRLWLAFSNPRKNTGAFYDRFHKFSDTWHTRNLDSRTVEGSDYNTLEEIITAYGDDSDEARVEVKGQFPRQGDNQFISREIVDDACKRDLIHDDYAPLVMGVDPARFGSNSTVIAFRQGRDARSIPWMEVKSKDNMEVAQICANLINKYNPDIVCIDAGNGTGIIDRLREMGFKVFEVWFGVKAEKEEYFNKRTEMWAGLKEWLKGGCIDPNMKKLVRDLTLPQYTFQGAGDKIMLEQKEKMVKRGEPSPDFGDALACTFAVKGAHKDIAARRRRGSLMGNESKARAKDVDYDFFG